MLPNILVPIVREYAHVRAVEPNDPDGRVLVRFTPGIGDELPVRRRKRGLRTRVGGCIVGQQAVTSTGVPARVTS
jgi:hypothetical protein